MKRILLLMLLVCSASAWAQDVIVKRDGSTILCRVVEVNKTEVIYKRWTNLNGPNYVMNLSDLSAINYENGEKIRMDETQKSEDATTATPLPMEQKNLGQQTVSDDALLRMAANTKKTSQEKARTLKKWGLIGGITMMAAGAGCLIGYGISEYGGDTDLMPAGTILFGGGAVWTAAFLIKSHKIKKKANSQLSIQTAPLYQHDFTLKDGTSLSAGVDMLKDNTRHNATLGVGLSYNF